MEIKAIYIAVVQGKHIFFSVNNKLTKKCIFSCPEAIPEFRSNFLMVPSGKKKKNQKENGARTLRRAVDGFVIFDPTISCRPT